MSSRLPPTSDDLTCAITGIGLAAGLGLDAEAVWRRVRLGESCFAPMPAIEQPLPPGADGGQAPDLPADYEPTLPREARYLRWTIEAALRDAGLAGDRPYAARRCTLMLGTTLHGMRAGGAWLRSDDAGVLATFLAGDTVRLAAAGLGLNGGAMTTCSACSSSLGAIALGATLLARGEADCVVAGGYDTISEYAWAGFNALRVVSGPPLRPFARGRAGMKLAEGYGIVVLERQADADRRGARPRAIVAGWGESADAHHLTRPHPEGDGALAAMRQALDRAGIAPRDLDLIAAHATGTPDNDSSEASAIGRLLGDDVARAAVVGFKSHLGHTLGGAGAVELILSTLAIRDGVIPPTANVAAGDVEYPTLPLTTDTARAATIRCTLNTSLGFGGANTCVVLREPAPISTPPATTMIRHAALDAPAWITGIGVLLPGAIGNAAFVSAIDGTLRLDGRAVDDAAIDACVNARRTRRMSQYVRLSLAATTLACRDADLADGALVDASAILGTQHGSTSYCYDYYAQVVREGVLAANPMLFAEGVPNAAAAQISLMLGLRGACQTILGTRASGLDALRLAALRIANGETDRVIVCAAEESHWTLDAAWGACNRYRPATSGAVAFVVESQRAIDARGARPYASIGRAHAWAGDPNDIASIYGDVLCRRDRASAETVGALRADEFFSVTPMVTIAANLLRPRDAETFNVGAGCRCGVAVSLDFRHANARRPQATTPPIEMAR